MSEITLEQRDLFHRDGFIVMERFFDPEEVRRAIVEFEPVFSGHFATGVLPDKVKWLKGRDPDSVPRSMCNVWKSNRKLAQLILAESIGKVAARLMNWPGSRLNQDSIMWIPPRVGTICFHQDNSYQDWHNPGGIITCWIALSETTADGGSIEYARGSHLWPLSSRVNQFASPSNYRSELDFAAAQVHSVADIVPVVVRAGGVAFHHGKIWHGSNYNRSSQSRYSLSTHCMSSVSQFHPKISSPMFNHYKYFGELTMDESFFPILWSEKGERSKFLEDYLDPNQFVA